MAITINEEDILAGNFGGNSNKDWVYNGLDCCITSGVHGVLAGRCRDDPATERTYRFELSCQSPALAMMLRGAAFDEAACAHAIRDLLIEEKKQVTACSNAIGPFWDKTEQRKGKCADGKPHAWNNAKNRKADERYDVPDSDALCSKCSASRLVAASFNPLSSAQVIRLLYDVLSLPKQYSRKGARGITGDDEALEKLKNHKKTTEEQADVIRNILEVRKAHKQIGFLRSRRSSDGRLRQSVNVGATETGRWSASKDPFREGTNFQNIADRSRYVIVADPGLWMLDADLEQAESKIVAFDSEDLAYIAAHESGDVHTFVASMVWPELGWDSWMLEWKPGDPFGDMERARECADQRTTFDPEHSFRDYAKHVQHGGNIGQSAFGMARDAHIPVKQAEEVYERMYGVAFPSVRRRQKEIMAAVRDTGLITTPLGRKRQFFGRLWEPATQREGMAQTQQSTVADIINVSLHRIWKAYDLAPNVMNAPRPSDPNKIWLLAQIHDAILALIRPHDITTLEGMLQLMRVPILIRGAWCTIGVDCKIGSNFRAFNPKKPETVGGLAGYHYAGNKIIVHNTKEYLK